MPMMKSRCLQEDARFEKMRFLQSEELSNQVFEMMDKGKKVFPNEGIKLALDTLRCIQKSSAFSKILIAVFVLVIFAILPAYMSDLMEQTSDEIDNEDFIRYVAADYFIHEFNDSPFYMLFGSGLAGGKSALAVQIDYLQEVYFFFKSDCGFIGYYSDFGWFGIGAMLYLIVRIVANYKYIDQYLLLYLLLRIEISFFDFWGNYPRNLAAWFIYLYLIECSIRRNKQKRFVALQTVNV